MYGLSKSDEGLHARNAAFGMTLTLLQDRSLGSVELHVDKLAKESEGDAKYPFESLGKKEAIEPLRLDGNQYKGNLHYVAEFVPALALRGVEFDSGPNALQQGADGGGSDAETVETTSLSSMEGITIPHGITTSSPLGAEEEMEEDKKNHKQGAKSTDTTATVDTTATNGGREPSPTAETKMEKEEAGITMTKEELVKQRMDYLIPKT